MQTRLEKDSLGERPIPADAYHGIQTDRAIENFPISGLKPKPSYIDATVRIKKAAARVNKILGLLDGRRADAIVGACNEILSGKLREWFVVDVYQAGAGTSHNMNANEVIANRAIELLGGTKGDYSVIHPNDHVNMAQSTNDVCPTAIRISAILLTRFLLSSLQEAETQSSLPPARPAVGQVALSAPRPADLSTTERSPLANLLGARDTPPAKESRIVLDVLNAYRRTFGVFPTGEDNRQIVNALLGANAQNLPFIPLDHPRLNARGEITDAWGTPFFFHVNSRDSVEVRSAGPDRSLFTADDIVAGRPPSQTKRPMIPDQAPLSR